MDRAQRLQLFLHGFVWAWVYRYADAAGGSLLLEAVGLAQQPLGVVETPGMCKTRAGSQTADKAFQITKDAVLTLLTASIFPDEFPEDFSILATIRPEDRSRSTLFSLFSDDGGAQLTVEVGRVIKLFYQDEAGKPEDGNTIKFRKKINDGKWHRVGISVKGNSATLLVDCKTVTSLNLARDSPSRISQAGLIVIGQQLNDQKNFEGDIQQLDILGGPEAAYDHCQLYMPDCDEPLPAMYAESSAQNTSYSSFSSSSSSFSSSSSSSSSYSSSSSLRKRNQQQAELLRNLKRLRREGNREEAKLQRNLR